MAKRRRRPRPNAKVVAKAELAYGLRRWREGMRRMNEITAQEVRALTGSEKSRLVETLFESGLTLRWPDRTREDTEVAERWDRLRKALATHD